MATLTIPDATYQRLQEIAAAMRLPLDEYLYRIAAGEVEFSDNHNHVAKPGTAEWLTAFNAWLSSHPPRPFIADDSRDAIYSEERD